MHLLARIPVLSWLAFFWFYQHFSISISGQGIIRYCDISFFILPVYLEAPYAFNKTWFTYKKKIVLKHDAICILMLDCLMDVLNVAKLVLLTKLEVTWRLKLRHHIISCMADVTCMSGVLQKSFSYLYCNILLLLVMVRI
jgi:hypothetical protein